MLPRKAVHAAFEVSLFFKGAFAIAEIAASIFACFVTKQYWIDLVQGITAAELTDDPRDFIAARLFHAAQDMLVNSQRFTAMYLLVHGVVKIAVDLQFRAKKAELFASIKHFPARRALIPIQASRPCNRR
ncbi:MAG: DUF2127 domain-containing protein [Herminiimonas sp.]|nr:DUF2127 domain-containing protein [Herminiimonas sp.]